MGLSNDGLPSIEVRRDGELLTLSMVRPELGNAITSSLVAEMTAALDAHQADVKVVVLEGSPEVFCMGADFKGIERDLKAGAPLNHHVPDAMFALWQRLSDGPFVSVAHVRGKVNAGGVGFVAACDVVLSAESTVFSLSEMMFGLIPACVLPFLARRIGRARANYLTMTTLPISARQAEQWGLVDACEENSEILLRKHLLRLRRLSKSAVMRFKNYALALEGSPAQARELAVSTNLAVFSDPVNLGHVARYVSSGRFPWEAD